VSRRPSCYADAVRDDLREQVIAALGDEAAIGPVQESCLEGPARSLQPVIP
jgi:hypothetical protein